MSQPFLRQCWYVAAWADELTPGTLLARRLLGDEVVLWRDAQGAVNALADRCPHRFAPLSTGRLMDGGAVQCPYHGLEFNAQGRCSHNPHGDGAIPKAAQVRAYAVVERHTAVWIWMGDAERADPALIPDYAMFAKQPSEGYRTIHGVFTVQAGYELEIDNLMDLSHPEFLHASSLGSSAQRSAHYEAFQEGETTVHSNRWFESGPCPPLMEQAFPTGGQPVEHWTNMRWDAPSLLMLHVGVTLTGQPRGAGLNVWSAHLLTPETPTSTHYFYTHTRQFALDSEEADEGIRAAVLHAFTREDLPMLESIQRYMGTRDLVEMKPVLLSGDAGGMRVRRLLGQLIAAEAAEDAV